LDSTPKKAAMHQKESTKDTNSGDFGIIFPAPTIIHQIIIIFLNDQRVFSDEVHST
jgi:hypothetical protein